MAKYKNLEKIKQNFLESLPVKTKWRIRKTCFEWSNMKWIIFDKGDFHQIKIPKATQTVLHVIGAKEYEHIP